MNGADRSELSILDSAAFSLLCARREISILCFEEAWSLEEPSATERRIHGRASPFGTRGTSLRFFQTCFSVVWKGDKAETLLRSRILQIQMKTPWKFSFQN